MKYTYIIILLIFAFLQGCKKEDTSASTSTSLTSKKWRLESLQVWNANKNEWTQEEKYNSDLVIEFKSNGVLFIQENGKTGNVTYVNKSGLVTINYENNGETKQANSSIDKLTATELEISGDFIPVTSIICRYYYKAI